MAPARPQLQGRGPPWGVGAGNQQGGGRDVQPAEVLRGNVGVQPGAPRKSPSRAPGWARLCQPLSRNGGRQMGRPPPPPGTGPSEVAKQSAESTQTDAQGGDTGQEGQSRAHHHQGGTSVGGAGDAKRGPQTLGTFSGTTGCKENSASRGPWRVGHRREARVSIPTPAETCTPTRTHRRHTLATGPDTYVQTSSTHATQVHGHTRTRSRAHTQVRTHGRTDA